MVTSIWRRALAAVNGSVVVALLVFGAVSADATPFTMTVPGANIPVPAEYPEAGGAVIIMVGVNGQIYYQFSDPTGAFRGRNFRGTPAQFQGNPFTINNPIPLDCGIRTCTDYFGGAIANLYIRFSAYDGDTQPGGFDENDINMVINGFDVGSWSGIQTQRTNPTGTVDQGFQTGFGNNSFNTAWFSSSNPALLNNLLTVGTTTAQVRDDDPNDNYWDFRRGDRLGPDDQGLRTIAPGYEMDKRLAVGQSPNFSAVGEVVMYEYEVTNIGSVDITGLSVVDDKVTAQGGTVSCPATSLAETTDGGPASTVVCTASYTITQADFDAEEVTNTAQATGIPQYGSLGTVTDAVTINGVTGQPSVVFTKTADKASFTTVGEVINYTFTITNDGDTTLRNIVVTDPNKNPLWRPCKIPPT